MIVDDDQGFGRVAAEILTDRGYRVVGHATTVAEALRQCDLFAPDGVLVDVRLPDGCGVQLAGKLNARPHPPLVLLTSTDRKAVSLEQLRQSGAYGFVPKTELAGFFSQ